MSEQREKDRYVNRRKMAWISFGLMSVCGIVLIIYGITAEGRADRINAMSFFIGTIFGAWITIIMAYFGVTAVTDTVEIKNEKPKPPASP
jgi:uncharacterized membrane protein